MPSSLRWMPMLWALMVPALTSALPPRAMAQTTTPLLQVEGSLEAGDATLGDGSFFDSHEFTGQAEQTVTILLESEAFDVYLILEDDQGNRIAVNDDIRSGDTNAALIVTLPAAGRYRVLANAYRADGQGPYRLTLQPSPAGEPNPLLSAAEVTLLGATQQFQAGIVRYRRSEFQAALTLWQQALAGFRAAHVRNDFPQDSRQGEAAALGGLGIAYDALGDYAQAIDFHQQQLEIARQIGDRQGEAAALGNLGNAYGSLGDYELAIDFHQQSLEIFRQIGDRQGEAGSLNNLGNAYDALGDYELAIDFHQQSLEIFRQIGDRQGEANALGNLGNAYWSLGDYERAIDFHQQALEIFRQIGDRQGEATSLNNLGGAYWSLGDYERAIDFHQQALEIARQIGDRQGEANALNNLGIAYWSLGDYERAIDFHQQALEIARQIGDRQGESASLHNLGIAFWYLEDLAEAERYFQASAEVQESLHTEGLADANRLSLLDSQQVTYNFWQQTLVAQGQPAAALAVAERSRAQALAVSMARSLEAVPAPPDLAAIQAIAAQQAATLVSYAVLPSGRIFIWVVQPDGTLHFAESDDAALDDSLVDTAAVLAGLGDDAQGGESPETPLNTLVQDTQAALTVRGNPSTPPTNKELSRHLQQLHGLLIEPIDQWLPEDDTQRVIFIPHRELFRIPFAALRDENGTYLIQKHTILTAPSIQSLALARQHRDRIQTTNATEALIVGNPTLPAALQQAYDWQALPGAEDEARRVGTYLSEHLGIAIDVLYQDQATETVVKDRLHSARFIHLATHGTLASSEEQATLPGLYSFIPGILALAPSRQDDGSLTADELLEITLDQPLNAELVVLSACQTGQGPITSDGVYGLSRVLLTAGAPTLVVSLWNASDPHTVALMDEFYRQFLEEDEDKAQALRQAMLMMIDEKEEDPNPQYWAAFTLVGNPE
jgi:CHAT domain-containing protein/Flp pilus assembly protein TadD